MKTTLITILGLSAFLASAAPAPADDIRKRDVVRRQINPSSSFPITSVVASASSVPVSAAPSDSVSASASDSFSASASDSVSALPSDSISAEPSASGSSFASVSASSSFPIGTGFSSSFIPATGTSFSILPMSTGAPGALAERMCERNGEMVCNGESEFGICNWGRVRFAPVARGTSCKEGKIVFERA